ncbi:MAG TPA: 50S ribosomal protein L25, partial [Patescibacteria group bacterium]|nr:50S ribosomal protein L25 [Patescibacteria group bacterium]
LVDFEATVHVRDLSIPSDVALLTDPDEIVARVQQPRIEEEPVVAAEGEGEEGEGEEGEAGEAGESASTDEGSDEG